MFGVEARFPWRQGLCARQSSAEARTVLQNKRHGCESLGELQPLYEVAPERNRLGPGTVLLVSGVFAEYSDQRFCVPPTTPPTAGRKMPNWRVMPCLVKQEGTGFPVLSRCLAAQGVDRLSTQVLGGESLALA